MAQLPGSSLTQTASCDESSSAGCLQHDGSTCGKGECRDRKSKAWVFFFPAWVPYAPKSSKRLRSTEPPADSPTASGRILSSGPPCKAPQAPCLHASGRQPLVDAGVHGHSSTRSILSLRLSNSGRSHVYLRWARPGLSEMSFAVAEAVVVSQLSMGPRAQSLFLDQASVVDWQTCGSSTSRLDCEVTVQGGLCL